MIDVTKIVREITYNGTKIPLLGTGDNIIKVLTEAELNALLVPENVDKLVAYDGELYVIAEDESSTNTPIAVGDTIDKLYFNLSVEEPDFSIFDTAGFAQFIRLTDSPVEIWSLSAMGLGDEGYILMVPRGSGRTIAYNGGSSFELDGTTYAHGWNAEIVANDGMVSFDAEEIFYVSYQDIWGNFISKEPFGSNIIAKPIAGKLLSVDSNGDIVAEIIAYAEEASF